MKVTSRRGPVAPPLGLKVSVNFLSLTELVMFTEKRRPDWVEGRSVFESALLQDLWEVATGGPFRRSKDLKIPGR